MTEVADKIVFYTVNGFRESVREGVGRAKRLLAVAKENAFTSEVQGLAHSMCAQAIGDLIWVRNILHRICTGEHHGETIDATNTMVSPHNCVASGMYDAVLEDLDFVVGTVSNPYLYANHPRYQQAAVLNLHAALEVLNERIRFMQGQK